METQEITIRTNHPEEVVKGAAISTCTSELGYDSCTGMFESNLSSWVTVEVEHIDENYSEYVPGKACNGGCYGYDYWRVLKIVEGE